MHFRKHDRVPRLQLKAPCSLEDLQLDFAANLQGLTHQPPGLQALLLNSPGKD